MNCQIFMTNFNFIVDTICVPCIVRKRIFQWNYDWKTRHYVIQPQLKIRHYVIHPII